MTWYGDLINLAKKLVNLQNQVNENSKEIKALRENLKSLTKFTRQVAQVVERNQITYQSDQKLRDTKDELLVLQLKNALFELELRLGRTGQPQNIHPLSLTNTSSLDGLPFSSATNKDD